jgi:hypothetical protein
MWKTSDVSDTHQISVCWIRHRHSRAELGLGVDASTELAAGRSSDWAEADPRGGAWRGRAAAEEKIGAGEQLPGKSSARRPARRAGGLSHWPEAELWSAGGGTGCGGALARDGRPGHSRRSSEAGGGSVGRGRLGVGGCDSRRRLRGVWFFMPQLVYGARSCARVKLWCKILFCKHIKLDAMSWTLAHVE